MASSIWNKKLSGLPGALCIMLSIAWARLANWITTQTVLGNIKHHGEHVLVMRGCTYRYPQLIEIGDDVIIGCNATMTAEMCKEYDDLPYGGVFCYKSGG